MILSGQLIDRCLVVGRNIIGALAPVGCISFLIGCGVLDPNRSARSRGAELSHALDSCNAQGTQTPFPPVHKLNNEEYDRSIKDILASQHSFSKVFPVDQTNDGFKTDAKAHVTSALSVEHYLQAAGKIAREHTESIKKQCASSPSSAEGRCFEERLGKLAEKAYRRPLTGEESRRLKGLFAQHGGQGAPEAFQHGVRGILLAPQFLFRINGALSGEKNLEASAKASRLSYFLWGSAPDDALRERAQKGLLADRDQVRSTVKQMLESDRSEEFVTRFSQQWLLTTKYEAVASSGKIPVEILEDMSIETGKFLRYFLRENISVRKMLNAKFTFASHRLADFYGLPRPSYPYAPVRLEGSGRMGLLTQGSLLAMTSNGTAASPVKRAKWILDRILCQPPGAPPMMAELENSEKFSGKTMRERLEHHRQNPSCAGCHAKMDPIGLAFESFDIHGKMLSKDQLSGIDLAGVLPDGTAFDSHESLIAHFRVSAEFPRCLTTKLATFALGRAPDAVETCKIKKIAERVDDRGYGFRDLVTDLGVELLGR